MNKCFVCASENIEGYEMKNSSTGDELFICAQCLEAPKGKLTEVLKIIKTKGKCGCKGLAAYALTPSKFPHK